DGPEPHRGSRARGLPRRDPSRGGPGSLREDGDRSRTFRRLMSQKWILTVAVVALLLVAALIGVARVASGRSGPEPVMMAPHAGVPPLPTSVEASDVEPSASPALTR